MSELKTCSMCKEELPGTTEYFYRNKATKDGLQSFCKQCGKEYTKKKYGGKEVTSKVSIIEPNPNVEEDALINIENRDGVLVTSSRDIAKRFDKEHRNVTRDIENIISQGYAQNCAHLFIETEYQNKQNKQYYKEYLLTRDGFSLLAMGFTGAKALKWKIKYIEAFNKMEEALRKQLVPTGKELLAMAFLEAKETMDKQVVLIDSLQQKIVKDAPKVSFADTLLKCEDNVSIELFAKSLCDGGIEIGRNRMFSWLRSKKILAKRNAPYQRYIINGAFQVKKGFHMEDGIMKQTFTTVITPKGQFYLYKKLRADIDSGVLAA